MKALSIRAWLTIVLGLVTILLILILGGALLMLQENHTKYSDTIETFLLGGLAILLASLLILAWITSRAVLKPLVAVIEAARQIGGGNLDFELPPSTVGEVAQVVKAFEQMGVALRSSLQREAELEQERRFFLMAIAHDLRTPLFSLRGHLQGLETGLANTPQKAAHYVGVCQAEANTLERLIEDLFAFAQLEYTQQPFQHETLNLAKLMEQTVEGFLPQAEAKKIALVLQSPLEPCMVNGDWQLLKRAFGNLLDNALRYTVPNGRVEIGWQREAGQISFAVADNGPGIAPQDLPHLFEPLYRGETSRSRRTGGAGLGLTISQRILQVHGGDLRAANRPGGGAIFSGSLAYSPSNSLIEESLSQN